MHQWHMGVTQFGKAGSGWMPSISHMLHQSPAPSRPKNFVGRRMRACTVVRVFQVKNNQKREKACAVEGWALAMAGADAHLNLDLPHTLGHLRMEFTIPPQQVRDNHLLPLPTINNLYAPRREG